MLRRRTADEKVNVRKAAVQTLASLILLQDDMDVEKEVWGSYLRKNNRRTSTKIPFLQLLQVYGQLEPC